MSAGRLSDHKHWVATMMLQRKAPHPLTYRSVGRPGGPAASLIDRLYQSTSSTSIMKPLTTNHYRQPTSTSRCYQPTSSNHYHQPASWAIINNVHHELASSIHHHHPTSSNHYHQPAASTVISEQVPALIICQHDQLASSTSSVSWHHHQPLLSSM